ncbi:MAG: J domain-containing protein [Clostridiales bacterium]|jgi:cell fate (sporulation/competence/biofilm development) regulator YmcA (YheA/YmcA/DUF963 family)|nr:J domain-containing protein [Clostridiales bacterium]
MYLSPKIADAFTTLGLEPGATEVQVNAAHKEIAKKYHPDLHMNDTQDEIAHLNELLAQTNTARKILLDYLEIEAAKTQVTPDEEEKALKITLLYAIRNEITKIDELIQQGQRIKSYFKNEDYINNMVEMQEYTQKTKEFIKMQHSLLEKIGDQKIMGLADYKWKLYELNMIYQETKISRKFVSEFEKWLQKSDEFKSLMDLYIKSGFKKLILPKIQALIEKDIVHLAAAPSRWWDHHQYREWEEYMLFSKLDSPYNKLYDAISLFEKLMSVKPKVKKAFATFYDKHFFKEIGFTNDIDILNKETLNLDLPSMIDEICERVYYRIRENFESPDEKIETDDFLNSIEDFYNHVESLTSRNIIKTSDDIKDFKKAIEKLKTHQPIKPKQYVLKPNKQALKSNMIR